MGCLFFDLVISVGSKVRKELISKVAEGVSVSCDVVDFHRVCAIVPFVVQVHPLIFDVFEAELHNSLVCTDPDRVNVGPLVDDAAFILKVFNVQGANF